MSKSSLPWILILAPRQFYFTGAFAPVLIVSDLMSDYDDVWETSTVPRTPNINVDAVLTPRLNGLNNLLVIIIGA